MSFSLSQTLEPVRRSEKKTAGVYYLAPILILILTLAIWIPISAQSGDPPAPNPVILTDEQGEYPLGLHLEILEDPSGKLTIDQVSAPEFDSQFVPSQAVVPNYGFTDSSYWVRLRLDNEAHQIDEWLLEVGFANMQYIDLYTPLPAGDGFEVKQTGSLRPVSTRDVFHPRIVFDLIVPTQSQQTAYLRFQNGASMTLPLTLWSRAAFLNRSLVEQTLMGIFYGVLIGLLFYNLFLLYSLREANYFYFVILLASLIIEEAVYDGYWRIFIIPNLDFLNKYHQPLFFSLLIAALVLFSDAFLELKRRLPKLHRVNLVILAVWGALTLLIPFVSYHDLAVLMAPWCLVSLVATMAAGIATWRQGYQPARFFMIAWFGLIVCFILLILVRLGIAPSTLFSENLYRLGFVWMAVCWSIALADRINVLKAETESANRDLRKSEHRLSQVLEGLPLGVILYGKDQKPKYANQRTVELLSNPAQGIKPDMSVGRTLAQAIQYFSFRVADSNQIYPIENFPVYNALKGEPASSDDIEMERGDERVTLEILASPVRDATGNVESVVVAIQDITQRKQAEAELVEYRKHLETLVENRTAELSAVNEQLQLRLEWLSAVNLVNQIMARSADFTEVYNKIIEIINQLFGPHGSFIAELDAGSKQLKILAHSCRSENHPDLMGSLTTLPESILSDSNPEGGKLAVISVDQLSSMGAPNGAPFGGPFGIHIQVSKIKSIALVPLQLREQVFGFLGLEWIESERIIAEDESDLLSIFSIDIAQLIEDRRLFEQAKALITAEERNRLARDLHDSVTQVLFSASLLAEVLPQIWRRNPELGLQKLEKLQQLTRGALAEMRAMLLELRPSSVVNTPLSDLLAQLAEAVTSRSGLRFQLFIKQVPSLPENVQINFYRIAQEALNNVVKHAQAKQVTMSLRVTPLPTDSNGVARHEVKLVIQDDGVGFASDNTRSDQLGIGIMQERAAAIQARLFLESQLGYGTQVTLIWSS